MCNLEFLGGRREDTAAHISLWIWSLVFLCRKTRKYEKCHERHISTKLRSFPWLWPQSSKGTTCLRCAYLRDTSCPLENAVQGEWRWFNVSLFEPIHGSDETECLEKEVRSIWGDIEDAVGNRGKVSEPPLTSTWLLLRPHWWSSRVWLFETPWTPGCSVYGISQTRILEWVAISFSRGSSKPRDQTWVSFIVGRVFIDWATREAH